MKTQQRRRRRTHQNGELGPGYWFGEGLDQPVSLPLVKGNIARRERRQVARHARVISLVQHRCEDLRTKPLPLPVGMNTKDRQVPVAFKIEHGFAFRHRGLDGAEQIEPRWPHGIRERRFLRRRARAAVFGAQGHGPDRYRIAARIRQAKTAPVCGILYRSLVIAQHRLARRTLRPANLLQRGIERVRSQRLVKRTGQGTVGHGRIRYPAGRRSR